MKVSRFVSNARRGARRAADRTVLSAVNAFVHFREGSAPAGIQAAPRDLVFKQGKLEVSRVRPLADEEFELGRETHRVRYEQLEVPVVLVPPLMVKPYVYDLRPEHSLVRTLRNAHFDVFVVDFGVPDRHDREMSLDDYVIDWIPRAIDEALKASGKRQVSLIGYSFGGIFALLQAGTYRDGKVRNLVTIGTPVDFTKMITPHWMARLGALTVSPVTAVLGNIPGSFSTIGFKLMGGPRSFTRWIDFVSRLYDPEYLRTFDTVNTWVNGLIPYPRDAFRQVLKEVVAGNKLVRGGLKFAGKECDLSAITAPLLAFAGRDDNVAPAPAIHAILELVGSRDKTLVDVSGGHVAIVGGTKAPAEVWAKIVEWLTPRSK